MSSNLTDNLANNKQAIMPASELKQIRDFARRPSLQVPESAQPVRSLAKIFGISLVITIALGTLIGVVSETIYEAPFAGFEEEDGLLLTLLLAAIIAPITEELATRLWLTKRRWVAWVGAVLAFLWALLIGAAGFDTLSLIGLSSSAVFLMLLVAGLLAGGKYEDSFRPQHVPVLVWAGALSFGILHISNYDSATFDYRFLWLMPILVSPQIAAGIIYSYVRVRLGFLAAVLLHSAENFLLVLLTFLPE